MSAQAKNFEQAVRRGRLAYWLGVRDAQTGHDQSNERARWLRAVESASYRLGRFHVGEGIIRRYPVAQVHDGPEFRDGIEYEDNERPPTYVRRRF